MKTHMKTHIQTKKDRNTKQETIIDKQIRKQQGENGRKEKKVQTKQYEIKHLQKYHYKTQYFNLNFFVYPSFFPFFYNCFSFLVLFQ